MRRVAAVLLALAASPAIGQGVAVDPAFRALQEVPREGPDLAPGPLEPPPSLAGSRPGLILPDVGVAAGLPGSTPLSASDLFGDGHGILYDGAAMENPLTDRGVTGRATIPF